MTQVNQRYSIFDRNIHYVGFTFKTSAYNTSNYKKFDHVLYGTNPKSNIDILRRYLCSTKIAQNTELYLNYPTRYRIL